MPNHEPVAIFWDIGELNAFKIMYLTSKLIRGAESCCSASKLPGHILANNIRQVAYDYGSVNTFKAYFGLSESSAKSLALRSELQCSGVSLIDCPNYDKKDGKSNISFLVCTIVPYTPFYLPSRRQDDFGYVYNFQF